MLDAKALHARYRHSNRSGVLQMHLDSCTAIENQRSGKLQGGNCVVSIEVVHVSDRMLVVML